MNSGFFNVPDGLYSSDSTVVNNSLVEPLMGLGILGFLVYLPCLIYALIKPLITKRKKDLMIFSFAVIFVVTLITMAYQIQYMTFSIRFLTSFCVVCAPVLAYSYCKRNNPLKFIIVFFAVFYLTLVSTNLWARPAVRIFKYFMQGATISQVREIAVCSAFRKNIKENPSLLTDYPIYNISCGVRDRIRMFDKRNKFLYFSNNADTLLIIKMLENEGYTIDFDLSTNAENIDFSKYNFIVVINDMQMSTNVKNYEKRNSDNIYMNNGIMCKYVDIKNHPIKRGSTNFPYKSVCKFNDYFFSKEGFELYNYFPVDYTDNGETTVLKHNFYENKNNPVINPLN